MAFYQASLNTNIYIKVVGRDPNLNTLKHFHLFCSMRARSSRQACKTSAALIFAREGRSVGNSTLSTRPYIALSKAEIRRDSAASVKSEAAECTSTAELTARNKATDSE